MSSSGRNSEKARAARARSLRTAAAVVCCIALAACKGDARAELVEAQGRVERDFAARLRQWQRAEVGAELLRGDGLRTGPKASAVLRVGRSGSVRVASDTTLRLFMSSDTREQAPGIDLEAGEAVIETDELPLPMKTPSGSAVLRARSRVHLSREEGGVRYQVVIGGADFHQSDGQKAELRAGESIVVGIGMAVLEPAGALPAAAAAAAVLPADAAAPVDVGVAPEPEGSVQARVSGSVGRRARGQPKFTDLQAGDVLLHTGDELHVREHGRAELARGDERATLSAGRYEIGRPGDALVRANDGKLLVSAQSGAVVIEVPGGRIMAQAVPGGSRADVVVRGEEGTTDVEVLQGRVSMEGPAGDAVLEAGEQATIAAADARDADGPAAAARRAPRTAARSAEHADLVVPAGETFRVYDPAPPTAIGFGVAKRCPQGAEVRVEGVEPVRGKQQVNVLVGPGLRRYSVHCVLGGVLARRAAVTAAVRVVRNDGTRRPPTSAARNDVDLDGRNYTLMYQNLRPILDVRWPDAPRASTYVLHVARPDGSVQQVRAQRSRATVAANLLRDGVHKLQFEAGAAKSKETKVSIVFDNAAPAASVRQPAATGFTAGESTTVSGVAVEGSRASIGGRRVPLDDQGRFSIDVPLEPGQRALAIRFKHPKHGIRYYLRRVAGGEK